MAVASWLAQFKILTPDKISGFAKSINTDLNLKNDIFNLLENERKPESLDPVIHQLFSFYRLDNDHLQIFALEFLPAILYSYFTFLYSADVQQKNCASIEVLLLGIYNIDAAKSQEEYLIDVNPPSSYLSLSSVYHNPSNVVVPSQLTKVTLEKHQGKQDFTSDQNLIHIENITNRNRLLIMSHSLKRYNYDISNYSKTSHVTMCRLCSLLIKSGLESHNNDPVSPRTRQMLPWVPVNESVICELLQAVYFIMYNGLPEEGYLALESLYFRALYDLLPQSILTLRAVMNQLNTPGGEIQKNPSNLSIPSFIHPTSTSKEAITTASFKPQLLPEDIDVKDADKGQSTLAFAGHLPHGIVINTEESFTKSRQKSMISKVFHIPMPKKKEDSEKKTDDSFIVSGNISPAQPQGSTTHFSAAKKALRNPFKSEPAATSTTTASVTPSIKHDFLVRKDTISISPYFTQPESPEPSAIPPVAGKGEKKLKTKGNKFKKRISKHMPASSSPKHSLSVSSYLSKDVIAERAERPRSDIDDEEDEDEDEQGEGRDGDDDVNEASLFIDSKSKIIVNDLARRPQGEKRHLFIRHITFANTGQHKQQHPVRSDTAAMMVVVEGSNNSKHLEVSQTVPLLSRDDNIPRLPSSTCMVRGLNRISSRDCCGSREALHYDEDQDDGGEKIDYQLL